MEGSWVRRYIYPIFLLAVLLCITGSIVWADVRKEPVDIIVALDKSLSMVEEIRSVKEYVSKYIVDQYLQENDYFLLVSFFGATEIIVSTYVKGENHKVEIKEQVTSLGATGFYTDIGNALDRLKEEVDRMANDNRKKTLLLITDGEHNPIPGSRYDTPDRSLSHEYLKNKSETQHDGWKVIFLDLGQTASRELADELRATYVKAPEKMTAEELNQVLPELTGQIEVKSTPSFSSVGEDGKSLLTIHLETKHFIENPQVAIDSIKVDAVGLKSDNILLKPYARTLAKEGNNVLVIPTFFAGLLKPGLYQAQLAFAFTSKDQFFYVQPLQIKVNSFFENNTWVIPAGIGGIVLVLALLALLLMHILKNNSIKFRLVVEERPLQKGKDIFTATKGKAIFLTEGLAGIRVTEKKLLKSIASLTAENRELQLKTLKEANFPEATRLPKDVLGSRITVRLEDGEKYHLRFEIT
jgi:hypothetical protein